MDDPHSSKVTDIAGDIARSIWDTEKSTWRTAARLGVIGAVICCFLGGLVGNYLYGWLGLLGGAMGGAVAGWLILTLVCYFLLSTASFFG